MENQKQKKSVGTVLLVILLLIVTIASLILATYAWAKYTSQETGSAIAQVAKWDVKFEPYTDEFVQEFEYVAPNNIAPGTSGQVEMTISSSNTEVSYHYEILMTKIKNKPTNLHFYTDANMGNEKEITVTESRATAYSDDVELDEESGKAAIGKEKASPVIYWNWAYETDTTTVLNDGEIAKLSQAKQKKIAHDLEVFANEKSVTVTDIQSESTDAGKCKKYIDALKLAESEKSMTDADIAKVVNNAIDAVDGEELGDDSMSFTIQFIATQKQPTQKP